MRQTVCMIETIYFTVQYNSEMYKWKERKEFIQLLRNLQSTADKEDSDKLEIELDCGGMIEYLPYSVMSRQNMPFQMNYIYDGNLRFRVFMNGYNQFSPDVYVMVASSYLWTNSLEQLKHESKIVVNDIINELLKLNKEVYRLYDRTFTIDKILISRWDYAHHTTLINDLDKWLNYYEANARTVTHLKLDKYIPVKIGQFKVKTESIYFGRRPLRIRIYNKIVEVFKMRYKDWFFDIWQKYGLITQWQKEYLEKAYSLNIKNYYTAKIITISMMFMDDFGSDEEVVKMCNEILNRFKKDYPLHSNYTKLIKLVKKRYKLDIEKEIPTVYNFEIEVRRGMIKDIIEQRWIDSFEEEFSTGEEMSKVRKLQLLKKDLVEKLKLDPYENVFNDDILLMNEFVKNANLIKDFIMENKFRIVDYKGYSHKKDAPEDKAYKKLRKTRVETKIYNTKVKDLVALKVDKEDYNRSYKKAFDGIINVMYKTIDLDKLPEEINTNEDIEEFITKCQSALRFCMSQMSENNLVMMDRKIQLMRKKYKKNNPTEKGQKVETKTKTDFKNENIQNDNSEQIEFGM